jgi:hypothetical protein
MDEIHVYQLARAGALPARLPPLTPPKDDSDDLGTAAMVTANVAAGIGAVVVLVELLVQSISAGLALRMIVAGLACVAGFTGARLAFTRTGRGEVVLFVAAAITLVLTLGWLGALSALLFLVAAGLAYFGGNGGARPRTAPPKQPSGPAEP